MFRRIKKFLTEPDFTTETELNVKALRLPSDGLANCVRYYENYKGEAVPIQIVVIYNVEQLAVEIAKCLKGSTNDSSNSHSDGN